MSRTATKVTRVSVPKELPKGLEIVECSRTIPAGSEEGSSTVKGAVVSCIVPQMTAEGVRGYIAWRSSHLEDDAENGVAFAAAAIRTAIVSGVVARLTPTTVDHATSILPAVSDIRTVDKAAAAGDRLSAFIREQGRAPNDKELAGMLAGLMG